jgi:peptidoglycan-associated lipoprotein
MEQRSRFMATVVATLFAAAFIGTGCSKKPPQAPPQPPPAQEQPKAEEVPPPPPPQEEAKPVTESVLSESLQDLNAKGYLKDAFFDFDKSELRDDARTALASDADWLKQYSSIQVLIEGHCDERGTEEYNLALGDRRANAAKEYLASLGVDGSRMKTVSYGKDRPFCTEHTEDCWQQNRRAHLVITAK